MIGGKNNGTSTRTCVAVAPPRYPINKIANYENVFGLKCYAIEEVKDQMVRTAFFKLGDTKIELLESTDDGGPIARFTEKKGEGLHHIAFAVENIEQALQEAGEKGINLIDREPRGGAEGLAIGFLHPKSTFGVLTELCEDKKSK